MEQSRFFALLVWFTAFFGLFSCQKPPENPFLTDAIFNDYKEQLQGTENAIAKVDDAIKDTNEQLGKTPPQSPQIRFFKGKLETQLAQKTKLLQEKRYWEGKITERKVTVTYKVHKAFYAGEATDGIFRKDTEEYMAAKKLRQARLIWSQREKVAEYQKSSGRAPASHGEAPKEGHH